ncbi:MAG: PfkB family carbohydrate kinase [Sulfitobacter sp.]
MSGGVIVVGSLHYDVMVEAPDRPRKGETVTGKAWYPKFGGKGGNQAVAAAKAGAAVRFVGAVGADSFADMMLETLQAEGVATDRVATIENTGTGMSVAIIDAEGDYGAVIVSAANLQIDTAQFTDPDLWQGASVLILQNEVPEAVNIAAARTAHDYGLKVCLNAAPWRAMSPALLAQLDILVVNAVEAEDMGAAPVTDLASAQKAAIDLVAQVPTVIVTAGGDGMAWAARDGTKGAMPALPVKVVSTHGAGDMFIGTFCRAIAQGADVQDALTQANGAAARHISSPRQAL